MFYSEFCEISKNTFFRVTPPVAVSIILNTRKTFVRNDVKKDFLQHESS